MASEDPNCFADARIIAQNERLSNSSGWPDPDFLLIYRRADQDVLHEIRAAVRSINEQVQVFHATRLGRRLNRGCIAYSAAFEA